MVVRKVNGLEPVDGVVNIPNATNSSHGLVQTTQVVSASTSTVPLSGAVNAAIGTHGAVKASTSNVGHVRVDGDTITVDEQGIISTSERMRIWKDTSEQLNRPIRMFTRSVPNSTGIIEVNYAHVGFTDVFTIQATPVPLSVTTNTMFSNHIEEFGLTKAKIRTMKTIGGVTSTDPTNYYILVIGR